jgi:hypothetical protein
MKDPFVMRAFEKDPFGVVGPWGTPSLVAPGETSSAGTPRVL